MANEQSPELHDDKPVFRAETQDPETSSDDETDANLKVRQELYWLANQFDEHINQSTNPSATKPPEEGSDTYIG